MACVLLVGEDESLLESRAALLRTVGVETLYCYPSAALAVQAERHCDLIVLCHSMLRLSCAEIALAIHAGWPHTRVLQIARPGTWESSPLPVDAVSSADPGSLIDHAVELLGRRRPAAERPVAADPALRSNRPAG